VFVFAAVCMCLYWVVQGHHIFKGPPRYSHYLSRKIPSEVEDNQPTNSCSIEDSVVLTLDVSLDPPLLDLDPTYNDSHPELQLTQIIADGSI